MEGPGVHAIAARLSPLAGRRVAGSIGRSRFPLGRLDGGTVARVRAVGKLLFIEVPPCTLRIHFLMWGRYRLEGEIPGKTPKLAISFDDGSTLRLYATAIALFPSNAPDVLPDPTLDPLDAGWDLERAARLVKARGDELICDTLMDQAVLPGVGNIIKNEALFAARVHPASPSGCIPARALRRLLTGVRDFSLTMFECDREVKSLRPFLKVYRKKVCPECGGKTESGRPGSLERISYWCPACQKRYRC